MFKERLFKKDITIQNFRLLDPADFSTTKTTTAGKPLKIESGLIAQVYYTPRGYSCEVDPINPLDVWDAEHYCRVEGINEKSPDGDLQDYYFDTMLAAMHFITRRLKKLGWDPIDSWSDN